MKDEFLENSHDFWRGNREQYLTIERYVDLAIEQKLDALRRMQEQDPIRRGITIDRWHPQFECFLALAMEIFPSLAPAGIEEVHLTPDPWKSDGFWRLMVTGNQCWESAVSMDRVRKALE